MSANTLWPLRAQDSPCKYCGATEGTITPRNGQQVVNCAQCAQYLYCAPRTETGEAQRSVTTIHNGISASKRARIFIRGNGQCEVCGGRDQLHLGHVVSVDVGFKAGLTDEEINHDNNLYIACEECNLGQGREVLPLRMALAIYLRREKSA